MKEQKRSGVESFVEKTRGAGHTKSSEEQSFRFMDLPIEIRVKVYERLPRRTKHYTIRVPSRAQHGVPRLVNSQSVSLEGSRLTDWYF
ncbi:hypothetical protein CC80DRAFT_547734 [Byssothecium circinans]|uniref:F-box domain-containing protein n=1 Tax=Byssothecium circinans TaxID=147558 RepID=A0A6A5TWL7_9PLEO|nr:hypothetical protein CC80DRAFT_547734 [Byssothecium circinans]